MKVDLGAAQLGEVNEDGSMHLVVPCLCAAAARPSAQSATMQIEQGSPLITTTGLARNWTGSTVMMHAISGLRFVNT